MIRVSFYCLLMFLFSCTGPGAAQQTKHVTNNHVDSVSIKLDRYFSNLLESTKIPGIAVSIINADSISYSKAFGFRNLSTKEPLNPGDIFHAASVSKPFMATTIVQLMEKNKIDLDEKLIFYLPYFKMSDPRYREITIKQMLNHTSGFPDVKDYEWDKPEFDDSAAERYARSLSNERLISEPGKEFHYSNMAFDVLAAVVAKVSGQSFETYVRENILRPLEMNESSFYQPETNKSIRTSPHTGTPPAVSSIYPYNRKHAPSSTLNTTVLELSNWVIANMNGGRFKSTKILAPASHILLTTPTFTINKENNEAVCLSWFTGSFKGIQTINHAGGDLGYRSNLIWLPSIKIGIVLLSNYDRTPMGKISTEVLEIVVPK